MQLNLMERFTYEKGIEKSYSICPVKFLRKVHWSARAQQTKVVRRLLPTAVLNRA